MTFWTLVCAIALGRFASDILNWVVAGVLSYYTRKQMRKEQEDFFQKLSLTLPERAPLAVDYDEPHTIN